MENFDVKLLLGAIAAMAGGFIYIYQRMDAERTELRALLLEAYEKLANDENCDEGDHGDKRREDDEGRGPI